MKTLSTFCSLITLLIVALPALANYDYLRNRSEDDLQKQSDQAWESIRVATFKDRVINADPADAVVELKAPYRAEDPAVVPVSIHSKIMQTEERYIKKLHIYLDKNPLPLVGVFEFIPASGKADLAMRIRVNDNTFFRVVTEMNNGDLLMSKSFIKSLGGCSEPLGASVDESLKYMGKMKIKNVGGIKTGEASLMQIKIMHPNITGLGASQRTGVKPPPHFIKKLEISYGGETIVNAILTFAISQDPSFRFFFLPKETTDMIVKAVDTNNNEFQSTYTVVFQA